MTTGQKIYEARKKAGMTQEELADRLNVSRQAVSKWESDIAFPETDKIIELCKLFSLSADELLLGAEGKADEREAPSERQGDERTPQAGKSFWDKEGMHFEYVSKTHIGSLPLVHVNFGLGHYRAKGVFAIGNVATGFFSIGLVSIGLVSWGVLALGLLAFGAFGLGLLLGAGGIATGALAFGGVAIGILCFGGCCVGYIGVGGFVVGQYAMGGYAQGFLAVGRTGAVGTHSFVMPEGYEELCAFVDSSYHNWIGNLIKSVALNLCG